MGNETTQAWPGGARATAPAAGVPLPFPGPLLAGTRGRLRGDTVDFILPNPSGGRGAYVAVWSMVKDLAGPTVHDTVLSRRLQSMPLFTPAAVRGLSRTVAAEGYAGRAAAAAAARAQAATDAEALRLWAMLLMALIRRSAIPAREHAMALASLGSAGPGQVTDGFAALSQRLGWNPTHLAEALLQVSTAFVPIAGAGRIRRLLTMLDSLQEALAAEHDQQPDATARPVTMLARTMGGVAQCLPHASRLLGVATLALEDPPALLERWRQSPAAALLPMVALEELLDGWDRICLLWLDATTLSARLEVLPQIALLVRLAAENDSAVQPVPAHPAPCDRRDAGAGGRQAVSFADAANRQAGAGGATSSCETATAAKVERNERIRALELGLDSFNG